MQDFKQFDFTITPEELTKAAETMSDIVIIINGEFYTLKKPETSADK